MKPMKVATAIAGSLLLMQLTGCTEESLVGPNFESIDSEAATRTASTSSTTQLLNLSSTTAKVEYPQLGSRGYESYIIDNNDNTTLSVSGSSGAAIRGTYTFEQPAHISSIKAIAAAGGSSMGSITITLKDVDNNSRQIFGNGGPNISLNNTFTGNWENITSIEIYCGGGGRYGGGGSITTLSVEGTLSDAPIDTIPDIPVETDLLKLSSTIARVTPSSPASIAGKKSYITDDNDRTYYRTSYNTQYNGGGSGLNAIYTFASPADITEIRAVASSGGSHSASLLITLIDDNDRTFTVYSANQTNNSVNRTFNGNWSNIKSIRLSGGGGGRSGGGCVVNTLSVIGSL